MVIAYKSVTMSANQELNMGDSLITKYSSLVMETMRNSQANFVQEHVYQVFKHIEANVGYTPFPADSWQSWDNLCKEKKEQKTNADQKVEVFKTKEIDVDGKKKKVKTEEKELKDKRLRKATTFNAQGKSALAFIITHLTHEAVLAADKITKSDVTSIKQTIIDNAIENCEYNVSTIVYTVCDKYDDVNIKESFPTIHGGLRGKLDKEIDKYIKNADIRNIVSGAFIKFLQIFTINIASNLWFETKESEDSDNKARTYTGKGTTTSDKQIRQFMLTNSNFLLQNGEKLGEEFFFAFNEFYDELCKIDEERKITNKTKRAETAAKKKSETEEKNAKAKSIEDTNEEPAIAKPAPPAAKAVQPVKESEPVAIKIAPTATRRRTTNLK